MKNLMNLILASATLMTSVASYADSVRCRASLTQLDLTDIVKRSDLGPQSFELKNLDQMRSQASGVFEFANGYQAYFNITLAKGMSQLIQGTDLLVMTAQLRQKTASGVRILASHLSPSDQISSLQEIEILKDNLQVYEKVSNPDIATAILNTGEKISAYEAVQRGLIPNGVASDLNIFCSKVKN